jgi:hypothetical protein
MSRTYAYNLDMGDHYYTHIKDYVGRTPDRDARGETPGAMTFAERLHYRDLQGRRYEAEDLEKRYARASSEAYTSARASTAPPVNVGFKGFYQRQLEASKAVAEQEASAKAAASASIKTASARSASVATSVAAKKTVQISESTTTKTSSSKKQELAALQKSSLEYGKTSASSAVRRAEGHAVSSFRDPRHTMVPHDITDDICKKVADIHMAPYARDEAGLAAQASLASWAKVSKMESSLEALTKSAMTYKSSYAQSASQMAKAAMSEDASAVSSSSKKTRKTIVESSSKKQAA